LGGVFVVLINFLNKAPDQLKSLPFPGQQLSCLDMIVALVNKTFELAEIKGDEIEAVTGITLLNAILENVQGLDCNFIGNIVDMLLKEM
jgi:hypothetical protein